MFIVIMKINCSVDVVCQQLAAGDLFDKILPFPTLEYNDKQHCIERNSQLLATLYIVQFRFIQQSLY